MWVWHKGDTSIYRRDKVETLMSEKRNERKRNETKRNETKQRKRREV